MSFNFRDKIFLITGGCGFIGSNIVRELISLGCEKCIILDNLFTGKLENVPTSDRVEFINGSINNKDLLDKIIPQVDYIISCAAVNIIAAQINPLLDLEVNAKGILQILETAMRHNNVKRVVYTSTASVYGNPEYLPVAENTRLKPMSNYAVSKLAGENYAIIYYLLGNISTSVVRYSNVYGPFQSPTNPYCGVIGKFISSALNGREVTIHGNGLQTRDFTYVEDAVSATIIAAIDPKAEGVIFNVATGDETTIIDLARKIYSLVGKELKTIFVDKRDIDNIRRRCLNIDEIRTRLKWEPRFDICSGLEKTIKWFKECYKEYS